MGRTYISVYMFHSEPTQCISIKFQSWLYTKCYRANFVFVRVDSLQRQVYIWVKSNFIKFLKIMLLYKTRL